MKIKNFFEYGFQKLCHALLPYTVGSNFVWNDFIEQCHQYFNNVRLLTVLL